jgi:hypothetical protein
MEPPTGLRLLQTSSKVANLSVSADTPPVLQLAGVALDRNHHLLKPWLTRPPLDRNSMGRPRAGKGVLNGIEWISVRNSNPSEAGQERRLIYNARSVLLLRAPHEPDTLQRITINDGDFTLHAPFPGINIPEEGRLFPPGSLQLIVDEHDRQIIDETTTLPIPERVGTTPCSGWCRRQHIYFDFGMVELAVIFFDRNGWPIACRENILNNDLRVGVCWWRFDYSRPDPAAVVQP